jgi:mannose-6-phosphate isomerase-like protein (cupin superfamily)
MARAFAVDDLPHLHSTRDTRDRLDLITDSVPVGATRIRADRIRYHPGDTAAAHYHTDCHHLFYVLEGRGVLHSDDAERWLAPGTVAVVGPGEVHWFSNPTDANFAFVEFWAPPPKDTVWVKADDI